ncbi:MAG: sugar-binding protein [Pseudomonadales bacterium]
MNGLILNFVYWTGAALLLMTVLGCDGGSSLTQQADPNFKLAPPQFLDVRDVNADRLTPTVTVNETEIQIVQLSGGQYSGTVRVPEGSNVNIAIDWVEVTVGNRPLLLATYSKQINSISLNQSIRIRDEDYDTSMDLDNDGISNLQEQIDNTDPFDVFDPGDGGVQVLVPYFDPELAPAIDGSWETVWRDRSTFLDRTEDTLFINNLMINRGATLSDGEPQYRWGAMHDSQNLYLWIEGESASMRSHFGDSDLLYNDDAVEIYWDGDNSKERSYDLIDDYQIIIPLLTRGDGGANNSSLTNARIAKGINSLPVPGGIEYATCIFCSNDIWEIKIPLNQARIPVGTPFGFEVQIDDDNDGGERDVKWGWVHPSRMDVDIDETWKDPSLMSTIRLLPSPLLSNN